MMTTNGIFSIFYGTAAADCGQCDQMLELKGSPNVDKSCSNSRNSVSYKNDPFLNTQKSHQSFWATLVSKFVTLNFQKCPIWPH